MYVSNAFFCNGVLPKREFVTMHYNYLSRVAVAGDPHGCGKVEQRRSSCREPAVEKARIGADAELHLRAIHRGHYLQIDPWANNSPHSVHLFDQGSAVDFTDGFCAHGS